MLPLLLGELRPRVSLCWASVSSLLKWGHHHLLRKLNRCVQKTSHNGKLSINGSHYYYFFGNRSLILVILFLTAFPIALFSHWCFISFHCCTQAQTTTGKHYPSFIKTCSSFYWMYYPRIKLHVWMGLKYRYCYIPKEVSISKWFEIRHFRGDSPPKCWDTSAHFLSWSSALHSAYIAWMRAETGVLERVLRGSENTLSRTLPVGVQRAHSASPAGRHTRTCLLPAH